MIVEQLVDKKYRNDIQGIRVLGAFIILIFHIWFNRVSGGVDVFFVVSGYLMASVLVTDYLNHGFESVLCFWARIAKRIIPSTITILIVTVVAGYFILPPTLIEPFLEEVISVLFHVENIKLILNSVDYLAREFPPSPVQQFWALSVQVQFYFLLPFILLPSLRVSQATNSLNFLFFVLFTLILSSFCYSLYLTSIEPSTAYFHPLTRAWEFFSGVFLFFLIKKIKLKSRVSGLFSIVGIVLLLCAALLVSPDLNYPGYVATIPVCAAILLILSGTYEQLYVNKLLATPWFSKMGSYSFTIYLWHWPVLVFYREINGGKEASLLGGLLIISASLVLAFLTSEYVEKPLKSIDKSKWKLVGVSSVAVSCSTAFFCWWLLIDYRSLQNEVYNSIDSKVVATDWSPEYVNIATTIDDNYANITRKQLLAVRWNRPKSIREGCQQRPTISDLIICEYGNLNSDRVLMLVGSSHAAQWMYPIEQLAIEYGFKLKVMTKSGCPFGALQNSGNSCSQWNKQVIEKLIEDKPSLLIVNATLTSSVSKEFVPQEWVEQWKLVSSEGIKIIGIRDNPRRLEDLTTCISRNIQNYNLVCRLDSSDLLDNDVLLEHALENVIDTSSYFCSDGVCPPIISNFIVLRDKHHINELYVRHISHEIQQKIKSFYPELF
ncbi:acyltransferase [Endozoicomonas sp. G2_1]|uniref:acyltransferase family protein n=1 Tax=Endozoicomonas sp. G2_1 TaxID=2821091 RepID=UPI001AD9C77F|nr:acyltransferase family protein [Endozoicomonas sp. G2_1]MBO9490484.1 acyltransferase [Endozoicomonas sp. G2_1]